MATLAPIAGVGLYLTQAMNELNIFVTLWKSMMQNNITKAKTVVHII